MDSMLNGCSMQQDQDPACDGFETHRVLEKIRNSWGRRAQVRRSDIHESHQAFDPRRPDFLIELLPFQNHPRMRQFTDTERQDILTCAWLLYNAKTLDIENHVVSPLCLDALAGDFPGMSDQLNQQLICETMVDESYHVLLTLSACAVTRSMRQNSVTIPTSTLIRRMQAFEAEYREVWQKKLIRFATCVVSEVFISDYLLLLSSSSLVQPLHRQVVNAHRQDEATHRLIFREFAKFVYQDLTPSQKTFFASVLPKPVRWFAAQDFDCWDSIFSELGIHDVTEMLHDCRAYHQTRIDIDYSGIIDLAMELGIIATDFGLEAFGNEGLLD